MTNKQVNEREIVLLILMEVTENGQFIHKVLGDVLTKYQYLDKRERAFITRVSEGTLEHLIEIDYILDQFSKVRVKKMKPVIRNLLRSGVYQLKYMDRIPDRAVCSESVKLAGKKGFWGLKGYVNGVLRTAAREIGNMEYPSDPVERMSIEYSCPQWIIRMWNQSYDLDMIRKMLADFQEEKPVTIRCCLNRISPDELKKKLEQENVHVELHPYFPYAFRISEFDHLEGLETFRKGLFTVQDTGSILAGELAAPPAGAKVLDVCAAPGGKALHVAEQLEKTGGTVEARDLTEYKVELIRENIQRMGLGNVTAVCRDASVFYEEDKDTADVVIADLPCSGLGVIGKKPDLKYRASEEEIQKLAELQKKILGCAAKYVKPGGILIYSTCTVSRAENMENVHWFLKNYPEFSQDHIAPRLCPELRECITEEGCIQLLPGLNDSDGFFIARLMKRREKDS